MLARIAGLIALALCCPSLVAQEPAPKRPWTLLVYAAADNNADGPVLEFMDRVRRAIDDDPGIDVLLFIDRREKFAKNARLLGPGFSGARLYRIKKASVERLAGGDQFPEIKLDQEVELDSADAANIGKFVTWGKAVSPADRYALLIYSHANGRTMCPDEQSKRDMGIAELTDKAGPECRVDFLALELCNMGGIEIAYQWRPGNGRFNADVLLAIPNAGPPLDWDLAFARIRSAGHECNAPRPPISPAAMTAEEFGDLVIEEGGFGRSAAAARGQTRDSEAAGSYDLRQAGAVKDAVDAMARALSASESKSTFLALRQSSDSPLMNYSEGGPYIDLYDLAARAAADEHLSADVRKSAAAVAQATDRFVLASFGMEGYSGFQPGKNGVFIVFPAANWDKLKWYTPGPAKAPDYGQWSFLKDGATPGNGSIETWFELLDRWLDSGDGEGINGYKP